MDLLRAEDVEPESGERVFRHGRLAYAVLLVVFALPLFAALVTAPALADVAAALPWFAWLALAPVLLVAAPLYAVVLGAIAQVVRRSFGTANWLLRVSSGGVVVHLRSFQNAHFPDDGPTAVRLAWSEIASAREFRDSTARRDEDEAPFGTRWLQIELRHREPPSLVALVRAERERKGPERKRLGVTYRARSGHVPFFVPAPGVLRLDWVGRRALRALGEFTTVEEPAASEWRPPQDVHARLRELVQRGDSMAAIELARRELGLSLTEARARVLELEPRGEMTA